MVDLTHDEIVYLRTALSHSIKIAKLDLRLVESNVLGLQSELKRDSYVVYEKPTTDIKRELKNAERKLKRHKDHVAFLEALRCKLVNAESS